MHTSTRTRLAGLAMSAMVLGGVMTPVAAVAQTAAATDMIISEYVEGSSNNKAIELHNGTDGAIDLSSYVLEFYFNGNTSASNTIALSGSVAPGDTFVVADDGAVAAVADVADLLAGGNFYNGNDAIVLSDTGGSGVVDSIGQVGVDPGVEWGTGNHGMQNNTLRRNADVCAGDTDTGDAYDPSIEYTPFGQDVYDGLGSHTTDCEGGGGGDDDAVDLIISEYVEGSSTNKALELFNGTDAPIDLTSYSLDLYSNGNVNALSNFDLEGSVASGDTFVFANNALQAFADQTTGSGLWNGDDVIVLLDGDVVVDSFGMVGVTSSFAANVTLQRLPEVCVGDTDPNDAFTTSDEYEQFAQDTFDDLGLHGNDCNPGNRDDDGGGDPTLECGTDATLIGEVQGDGDVSPLVGETVEVEGVVVGDFQTGGFDGYFVQDAGDGDAATSDGIFVFDVATDVAVGDQVRVAGDVSEFFGTTEVTPTATEVCSVGNALPAPTELTLPIADHEDFEGMYVTFPQDLSIIEYFNFDRFGEVVVGTDRQFQPTAVFEPGSTDAVALAAANSDNRITIDDGRSFQNPDPAIHPNGDEFTLDNLFRGGDLVTNATGVLEFRFDLWRLQPTQGADYTAVNPRPDVPEVGGSFTVASYNVLNYFTTFGSRGAENQEEFDRQEAKIVAALAAMDADVVGLIEIENNGTAVQALVDALNDEVGAGTYAALDTGVIGTDEITTAFIHKPSTTTLDGDFAVLDTSVDARFNDDKNRPALAQTFVDDATGGAVTVAVNHLKSKGSSCDDVGDPEDPDGQGNCNQVRTDAAAALADWMATDPTGSGADNGLIIGDLNAYDKEDPISALAEAGWTDLQAQFGGEFAYSYVFDGQLGYLDYALADADVLDQVTGVQAWHANADEADLIDYLTRFKQDAQDAIYAPDPYRGSDHDAVLVGLDLAVVDTTAPTIDVTVDPALITQRNHKYVDVTATVTVSDDIDTDVEWSLVSAVSNEPDNGPDDGNTVNDIVVLSDTEFKVRAERAGGGTGRVYTFTFEAVDDAGNTATASATVFVPLSNGGL